MLPDLSTDLTPEQKEQIKAAKDAIPKIRQEIKRAKQAGIDTTLLESRLTELDAQVTKLHNAYVIKHPNNV